MSATSQKAAQAWQSFVASLTATAKKYVHEAEVNLLQQGRPKAVSDDNTEAFASMRKGLTSTSRELLDQMTDNEPTPEELTNPLMARYCLVESWDGEWAVMRVCKTAEGAARRIGQIEGEDVVVFAAFGVPLSITKGPQRYMLLPDGVTAITIPQYLGAPCQVVAAEIVESMPMQEDGFVGPEALITPKTVIDKLNKPAETASRKRKAEADEEENDDDDDDRLPSRR